MQCGCPQCGILMTNITKGVESTCKCPACGYECSACLGTKSSVLSPEELRSHAQFVLAVEEEDWQD
jgi:DNA-directed RNA polymerase subunit M/transcription elongation factor TFIIS